MAWSRYSALVRPGSSVTCEIYVNVECNVGVRNM